MPRIYVASLSDYTNGLLLGAWIDLDGKDADDVQGEIAAMLRTSKYPNVTVECPSCATLIIPFAADGSYLPGHPDCTYCKGTGRVPSAEEWAIHDYDDCPNMGENPSIDDLLKQVEMIEEHGDAWRAYIEWRHVDDVSEDDFNNCCAGEADSELEWCEQFLDDCGTLNEIPENLRVYFDTERYLRDMKYGGDVNFEEVNGAVYAFWNH